MNADEWKIPQMLSDKTMNARCVRGQKAPGEVGKGGRGNCAKPWGGQRTARNRGVARVNGTEGRSNGTVEPSEPVGGADLSPLGGGW